jgi:hypothetical protein
VGTEHFICSCRLSSLLSISEQHAMYAGDSNRSVTRADVLVAQPSEEQRLTIADKVKDVRLFMTQKRHPLIVTRPSSETVWDNLVEPVPPGAYSRSWEQRWLVVSRASMSGNTRSLLWRILHRVPPLLSLPWFRDGKQRGDSCVLCSTGQPETFEHLLGGVCPATSSLWDDVSAIAKVAGIRDVTSVRARILGDIASVNIAFLANKWKVPPTKVGKLAHKTWTEIRGPCIRAIWLARCKTLHAAEPQPMEALSEARSKMIFDIKCIAHFYAPPESLGIPPSVKIERAIWHPLLPFLANL